MQAKYTDLNIHFSIDNYSFYALNIVFERFLRSIPLHSHSSNSYEIHYIPYGHGKARIDNNSYEVAPNTLYITGPHVEHEQTPDKKDPMAEYCIYLNLEKKNISPARQKSADFVSLFEKTFFWYGQDTQNIYPILQSIFYELEHQYTGYMTEVETLLQQLIVKLIRNYEYRSDLQTNSAGINRFIPDEQEIPSIKKGSKVHFGPSNLFDSKYIIIEESFLYEYKDLTLEILSSRLGLSPRQTERLLKAHYGKTFLQKKSEAKMSAALILLADPSNRITQIAYQLGYSSVEHFSTAFKRYYKKSARTFRAEQNLRL